MSSVKICWKSAAVAYPSELAISLVFARTILTPRPDPSAAPQQQDRPNAFQVRLNQQPPRISWMRCANDGLRISQRRRLTTLICRCWPPKKGWNETLTESRLRHRAIHGLVFAIKVAKDLHCIVHR